MLRWRTGSRPSNSSWAKKFASYADAKRDSFDYIEVLYNQQRRLSSIGYISPSRAECNYRDRLATKKAA
jgi:hypothetical protein